MAEIWMGLSDMTLGPNGGTTYIRSRHKPHKSQRVADMVDKKEYKQTTHYLM
uniref:Uncharacterized protein n=1 Tax=Arion vulgaris TaxID=1028688 RepID=A0A0B7AFG5_9EUPU